MTTTHAPAGVLTASSDAGGIHIVRVLDAPPELVFKCWTEPEHFAAWFGEHGSSMPVDTVTMDVRPGWRVAGRHARERAAGRWSSSSTASSARSTRRGTSS